MAWNGIPCSRCGDAPHQSKERAAACHRAYRRERRAARPEEDRGYALKSRYGMTVEKYDEMLAAQGGVCFLCQAPPKKRRLHVDHNHQTGAVRRLLCVRCNTFLGKVEDPEFMERVYAYLGNHVSSE